MSAITALIKQLTDGAADGTGIIKLVPLTVKFLHLSSSKEIPSYLIENVEGQQQSQFGSYPDHKDVAPCAVFVAIFAILSLAHLSIFSINFSRGHKFYLSLAFAFYCTLRWLGFALRLVWSKDILKLHVGIASFVLLILPTVVLASFNLVLAQRLFTWRHPVGGNKKSFWCLMLILYAIVIGVVVMTIVAGTVPYLYLLSQSHYDMCRNVVKVTSVLVMLYSLLAIALVILSFIVPASSNAKNCLVYQPFWIQSFAPTYFVARGASKLGENAFLTKFAGDGREPKRTVMGHTTHSQSHNEAQELNDFVNTGDAKFSRSHNTSILLIALTSLFVFGGALCRCISMLEDTTFATEGKINKPVVMYVMWGALETIVNVLYLVGRVDLRFYRPDALKKGSLSSKTTEPVTTSSDSKDQQHSTSSDSI